jgi:dihydrofolate reductase
MKISMIAAIGKNRELGRGNELLFKIPEDMKFFKEEQKTIRF